jgi:hypothetical protein
MSGNTVTPNFSRELSPNFNISSEWRDSSLKNGPKNQKQNSYLSFSGVTGVSGVTAALNAASSVTPSKNLGVTGVTGLEVLS